MGTRVSETTWTAGSAPSFAANADGSGKLEVTIRRGGGSAAMMRVVVVCGEDRREQRGRKLNSLEN